MTLTPDQTAARDSLLDTCPVITIVGPTGVGKTHFVGSVLSEEQYQKVLYIDGDRGITTIAYAARHPEICDLRTPKTVNAFAYTQWMSREILGAHKVEGVGCVVIEGLSRVYQELANAMMANATQEELMGPSLMRMYGPGAGMFKAAAGHIGTLQHTLLKAGRRCPIIVTMNTKNKMVIEGKVSHDVELPEVSPNCTKALMGRSEAFVELTRMGKNFGLKTDRDPLNPYRKVRGVSGAVALTKLRNPTLVTMIQTWADCLAADAASVAAQISK